jgi:DNA-binding response OmpR family regulator
MTGELDLRGLRVLIVEDEYFIATHLARALEGAGANIVGPSPTEAAAYAQLKDESARPDAVVLDINLGSGPCFRLAKTFKEKGIPFVFLTGYDQDVIPEEFYDIDRLEKPIQLRHIVSAISKLLTGGATRGLSMDAYVSCLLGSTPEIIFAPRSGKAISAYKPAGLSSNTPLPRSS